MEYVGLLTQIRRNNMRSIVLLVLFPLTLIGLVYLGFHLINLFSQEPATSDVVNNNVIHFIPFILAGVLLWFAIAWFSHTSMIQKATQSKPLERKDNKRVYNLLENLCISRGLEIGRAHV